MRLFACLISLFSLPCLAENLSGAISISANYRYQGMNQFKGVSPQGNIAWRMTDNFVAGLWIGRYQFPPTEEETTEIDYMLSYNHKFSFVDRIEISLWHYTFTDTELSDYDLSQLLVRYDRDERFTLTTGYSNDWLKRKRRTFFFEGTARHATRNGTFGVTLGHNNLSDTRFLNSFNYLRLDYVFQHNNWAFSVEHTYQFVDDPVTRNWAEPGFGGSLTWTF